MNKSCEGFNYIKQLFPKISAPKINEGIFAGPDIKKLLSDPNFVRKLNPLEKASWLSIVEVITNFLRNKRSKNYREIISNLLTNFQALGCKISLKIHLLHPHLYFFNQPRCCEWWAWREIPLWHQINGERVSRWTYSSHAWRLLLDNCIRQWRLDL